MKKCVVVYNSASVVHRAKKLLRKDDIRTAVVQLPSDLGLQGCSYGLECDARDLEAVLARSDVHALAIKAVFEVEQTQGGKVYMAYDLS